MPTAFPLATAGLACVTLLLSATPVMAGSYGHIVRTQRSGFLSSHIGGRHAGPAYRHSPGYQSYRHGRAASRHQGYRHHLPYVSRHTSYPRQGSFFYPGSRTSYRPSYLCRACNYRHTSRLHFYDHVHRHHRVARTLVGSHLHWDHDGGVFVYIKLD